MKLNSIAPFALTLIIAALTHGEDKPPNIVLIISDDQAWTDYSFMGHPVIETPRIDRLAEQSLTFPRGYVTTSLCCPSLATMITGLYPHQHKITGNEPPAPPGLRGGAVYRDPGYQAECVRMDDYIEAVPTLPRLLAKKGYVSLQTGKWWHGSYKRGGFTHGMTHGDPKRGGRHGDDGLRIGRQGMKPVFDFIEEAGDKPFFIWYAPFLPHTPHNPPKRLLDKYRDRTPHLPIAKYWAMCEWFDETCGELLDHLDEKNLSENTVVLFVTDNGWINREKASRYAPKSKRSPYDGGLRTPIMVRWPGKIEPRTDMNLASAIDLAPTILAAAGLERTPAMRGVNLTDTKAVESRKRLFGAVYLHNAVDLHAPVKNLTHRWCIEGTWKLIVPYTPNVKSKSLELFDLGADAREEHNRAAQRPKIVAKLGTQIDSWLPAD